MLHFGPLFASRAKPVAPRRRARIAIEPPFPVLYAVGDIHGCHDLLTEAEEAIAADLPGTTERKLVVLLGDFIDRGARSADVIDHLLRPAPAGLERICLCGNHEQAMLDFLDDPEGRRRWLDLGGIATLRSYGIDVCRIMRAGGPAAVAHAMRRDIPAEHLEFLRNLPVAVTAGNLVFVHAGVAPGLPLEAQDDRDLISIREPFLTEGPGPDLMVVHGHTVSRQPTCGPGRLGIDTGAYIWGRLTVLRAFRGRSAFIN